jgi:hypothetical protein
MTNSKVSDLVGYIKFYSDISQEVDTPCERILGELGGHGVDAVAELMWDTLGEADQAVPSYCAQLLAESGLPGSVEVLTDLLVKVLGDTTLPTETLDAIFDDALPYDRFLTNPSFLSAARQLSKRWNNTGLDRFLAAAQRSEGR